MERKYKITAETGLHARPATLLVNTAVKFKSELLLESNGRQVNMKSIMGVMSLGVYCGETIVIYADGPDALESLDAVSSLFTAQELGREI